MDDEDIRKNAEFLINEISGKEIPGVAKVNCRYKNLVNFAKIYGISDLKYVGPEEDGIIACHGFANSFTVKSFYSLLIGYRLVQDGKERPLITNPGKLLHAGNHYNWEGCVDVKNGDKLKVTAKWGKAWYVEKNKMFFAELIATVKNQNEELVCNVKSNLGIRPGGY